MAVRSRRIWGPTTCAGVGPTTLYTVPAGRTALIRNIILLNNGGATATVFLVLQGVGNIWGGTVAGSPNALQLTDEFIFNPGDIIVANVQTAGLSVNVTGFGSLLDGAPS